MYCPARNTVYFRPSASSAWEWSRWMAITPTDPTPPVRVTYTRSVALAMAYAAEKAHYIAKLRDGSIVPVLSTGVDYIATGNSKAEAMEKLERARAAHGEKTWAPGELYMKA